MKTRKEAEPPDCHLDSSIATSPSSLACCRTLEENEAMELPNLGAAVDSLGDIGDGGDGKESLIALSRPSLRKAANLKLAAAAASF
mmetsp:Transcript_75600/g.166988  ORF Transcript_75600/g.166988 Transcript_75600/m.166988 type:complete len:86 (-) Transcript_75600:588-845(-)